MTNRKRKVRSVKFANKEIERLITENGGYSKAALLSLGVPWPPQKGWKRRLASEMAGESPPRKKSSNFYSSWEWKSVRYEALRAYGHRCQCCGWSPGDTKSGRLVVDHIKPRSKYPALELDVANLQVLCNDCNMGKSNVFEDDFRGIDSWLSTIGREE